MPVGIETIEVVNGEALGMRMRRKSIDGKSHKLLVVQKDEKVPFGVKLYKNTKNVQATYSKVKWILGTPDEEGIWVWKNWTGPEQPDITIDGEMIDDYAAATSVVVHRAKGALNIGKPYWLEAFIMSPEFPEADIPKGIFITFIDKPQITSSVFTKINVLRNTEDEVGEGQIFDYGEILKIDINTHSVISRDDINITCKLGGEDLEFKRILHPKFKDDLKYNGTSTLHLHIDPKWRDEVGHGEGEIKELVVLVNIVTLEEKNEKRALQNTVKVDNTRVARRPMQFAPRKTPAETEDYEGDALKASYSFQVNYKGNSEALTERNKGVEQMVSVLDTKVVKIQSDKPCRYTSILVNEVKKGKESRKFLAFSENGNGTVNDNTEKQYGIVAGKTKNKKQVKIKVGGLRTKGCIAPNQEHNENNKIFNKFEQIADRQWLKPSDYEISNAKDQITLDFTFPYLPNDNALLKYFWPASLQPQLYFIPIQTCAYPRQGVSILVYPDIEVGIKFTWGLKHPFHYRDSWINMRQARVEDAVNKAQASDIDGYDGQMEHSFDFGVKMVVDNTELELKLFEHEEKIRKFIKIFMGVKNLLKGFAGDKSKADRKSLETEQRRTAGRKGLGKFKKGLPIPGSFTILSPQLALGASWKMKAIDEGGVDNYEVGLFTEGKVEFDPIIGAQVNIDLMAFGAKLHPGAYAIIKFLDLIEWVLDISVIFDFIITGKIKAVGQLDMNLSNGKVDKNNSNVTFAANLDFELVLEAKKTGKVRGVVYKQDKSLKDNKDKKFMEYEIGAKASAKGGFEFGGVFEADKKSPYVKLYGGHTGLKVTLMYKTSVRMGSRTKKKEFTFIEADKDWLFSNKIFRI